MATGPLYDYILDTQGSASRIDEVSPTLLYAGWAVGGATASTSQAIWKIQRLTVENNEIVSEWALNGQNKAVWDNRSTYFTAPSSSWIDNYSIQFDGVNDYAEVLNNTRFQFQRTDPFSVSLWLKPLSLVDQDLYIGFKDGLSFSDGWAIMQAGAGSASVRFILSKSASNSLTVDTTSSVLVTNAWTHIVVTYDGSSAAAGAKIYINGVSAALTVTKNNLVASPSYPTGYNFRVGADGVGDYATARIDDIAIWSSALSAGNVTTLYNAGKPGDLTSFSPAPQSWWWMGDRDSFPVITDHGSLGAHLYIYNALPSAFSSDHP